jgi:hypothetical protein
MRPRSAGAVVCPKRAQCPKEWQEFSDESGHYFSLQQKLPQGEERWVVIRTKKNLEATQKTLQKKADKDHEAWEKRFRRLGTQSFACQSDATLAWEKEIKKLPVWLRTEMKLVSEPRYDKAGRLGVDAQPVRTDWKIVASCQIDQQALEQEIDRKARFIIATNELSTETLSDEGLLADLIRTRQCRTRVSFSEPIPCSWLPLYL